MIPRQSDYESGFGCGCACGADILQSLVCVRNCEDRAKAILARDMLARQIMKAYQNGGVGTGPLAFATL